MNTQPVALVVSESRLPDRRAFKPRTIVTASGQRDWQRAIHRVIFEAETPAGRLFDGALLLLILGSVLVVVLDSVASIRDAYHGPLLLAEYIITGFFAIEYILRLLCLQKPWRYAVSFFGIIDLLAILPAFIGLLLPGSESLLVVRTLRLLRIFRVLKLARYVGESRVLFLAMRHSAPKIIVFLGFVVIMVTIIGATMYVIEGASNEAFSSIPAAMYWAIVTLTTVGYGDIVPESPVGRMVASVLMIMGYGIIAVPTGIVSVELAQVRDAFNTRSCEACGAEGHQHGADYCYRCGEPLPAIAMAEE